MCPKNDAPGVKNTRSYNALSESPPPVYLPQSCIAILVAIYWHTQLQRRFLAVDAVSQYCMHVLNIVWLHVLSSLLWDVNIFGTFDERLQNKLLKQYKSEEFLDGKGFIMISRSQDVKKCSIIRQSSKHLNLPFTLMTLTEKLDAPKHL